MVDNVYNLYNNKLFHIKGTVKNIIIIKIIYTYYLPQKASK